MLPSLVSDRRYNIIVYGIEESPKDTSRSDRQKHDLDKLLDILLNIDASLTSASIKDFHRLGKFKQSNNRPRPLLVKFLRTFEASLVLSNKDSLTASQISIKRDMSPEERTVENALLKERRRLIDSGTERKFIKIRGNSLYVRNKLHGLVQDSQFHMATNSSSVSTVSQIPVSSTEDAIQMETLDLQSANSNNNDRNSPHTQTTTSS